MFYQYSYFIGCIIVSIVWIFLFIKRKNLQKEMLFGSFLGVPIGLTDFLFVPEYWDPPNLFNLIDKIGFSIESLLLGFLVGGVASVIYEYVGKKRVKKIRKQKLSDFTPYLIFIIIFLGLEIIFPNKSIYNLSVSLIISSIMIGFVRKDLIKQIVISGFLFSFIYFVLFVIFNLIFKEFVNQYYNLNNLWGINLLGVPIEEIIFSFSVGAFWSTLFEYIKGYKTKSLSFFNRI